MAREVSIRIVPIDAGERTSLEENERVARVEWNGRTGFRLIIIQDPAASKPTMTDRQDISSQAGPRRGRERVARIS
jgi:hypothetical protein